MGITSLDEFYRDAALTALLPEGINNEIGHFNVFDIAEITERFGEKIPMPYNRRSYYKISLICGHNIAAYADKVIEIQDYALLFATPKVPYHYIPQNMDQQGHFCIFTEEFLVQGKGSIRLDELPIFRAGGYPVFRITQAEQEQIAVIFRKMHQELGSNYAFKYDLLRNYLMELIHYGQKLQPATALYPTQSAAARISSLFVELLERQFPIESPRQQLGLRGAKDYADRLSVHVNHLNKVLKEATGSTTTALIAGRILKEAKILLKQTSWTVSEIAWSLGFEDVAHFSNFFRRQAACSPAAFRG